MKHCLKWAQCTIVAAFALTTAMGAFAGAGDDCAMSCCDPKPQPPCHQEQAEKQSDDCPCFAPSDQTAPALEIASVDTKPIVPISFPTAVALEASIGKIESPFTKQFDTGPPRAPCRNEVPARAPPAIV